MNEDRTQQIEQAIADIEAAGRSWTNQTIFGMVGGNYASLSQYLKARRAGTLASEAVAVLEIEAPLPPPPAPPLPPAPQPPLPPAASSPLAQARTARDEAVRAEQSLAEQHSTLKRQRQHIEQRLLVLDTTRAVSPEAVEFARRQEARTLHADHAAVETERQRVFAHLAVTNARRLTTADAYREVQEQAGHWLRRMRQRLRESRTLPQAWARADALEESQQAAERLAELIGDQAVAALANDSTLQPNWLRD